MGARADIDFAALRRRLDRAEAEASAVATRSPERRREILEGRARALAATQESQGGSTTSVFVFEVAGDRYALGLDELVQVLGTGGLSPIPGAPPWLLGALAARARIVAVLDPRPLLGVAREGLSDLPHVLVVQHRGETVGIAVESLQGETSVREEGLAKPATAGPFVWSASDGLTRIDLERLLARAGER